MADINTHNLVVDFGRHKGTLWTRVPIGYLRWLSNQGGRHAETAKAELKRRGFTELPSLEVSGHAIDRASYQLMGKWIEMRLPNEGLHAWLMRVSGEARTNGRKKDEKTLYAGMKFVFEECDQWPVLKTVMLDNSKA